MLENVDKAIFFTLWLFIYLCNITSAFMCTKLRIIFQNMNYWFRDFSGVYLISLPFAYVFKKRQILINLYNLCLLCSQINTRKLLWCQNILFCSSFQVDLHLQLDQMMQHVYCLISVLISRLEFSLMIILYVE